MSNDATSVFKLWINATSTPFRGYQVPLTGINYWVIAWPQQDSSPLTQLWNCPTYDSNHGTCTADYTARPAATTLGDFYRDEAH